MSDVPQTRVEGDVTIIPVLEEIRIRKIATTEEVAIPVTLRKQRAIVERLEETLNEETKS